MINIVKKLKKKLIKSYNMGVISYPRVSNNYIKNPAFFLSPHAPLPVFDEYSLPLANATYPLNKKSSILELSNVEILTPSTIENVFETIDTFFDDNLNIKIEMKDRLDGLLKHFDALVETKEQGIDVNSLCKDGKLSYSPLRLSMFTIKLSPDNSSEVQKKIKYICKKEKATNFFVEGNLTLSKKSSLHEAMAIFHEEEKNIITPKIIKSDATVKHVDEYSLKI